MAELMPDELRETRAAARGARARALLEDELLRDAFATVDAALVQAWRDTPARDAEGRERLHLALTLLARVHGALAQAAHDGALSAQTLRHLRREPSAVARFLGR